MISGQSKKRQRRSLENMSAGKQTTAVDKLRNRHIHNKSFLNSAHFGKQILRG
jgi:hypothetical protein